MQTSDEPLTAEGPPPVSPRRGRRRRFAWAIVAAVVVLVVAVVGLAAASALEVRRDLLRGRGSLIRGKNALVAGDIATADAEFRRAKDAFDSGADGARSPWLSLMGSVPLLGNTADVVRAVADAGVQTADAATGLAGAVADLPGGLGALAPTADGIPIDRLAGLAAATARADELTGGALATLQDAPTTFVPSPVVKARADAVDLLSTIHRQLHAGSIVLQGLPSFLGSDEPRHYFFGAANPAELRGTGGLIGAYAILTVDHGDLSFSDFRPIQSLPHLDVADVPTPSAEYAHNWNFFRTGDGIWLSDNMTPDFPLAAKALWLTYRAATGQELDGIIVADPFALQALMGVTEPITVGATATRLTADNVVPFVTNEAYALFPTNDQRKLVLGSVAQAVLQGFLDQQGPALPRIRALLRAFDDGHVKAWSTDANMEEGLAMTTVGGAFDPSGTDVVSVVTNSASGTKLDFYQRRTVTYDIRLGAAGTALAALRVDLLNDSPTSGYPAYVIGPFRTFSREPGQNLAVVNLYCDVGCVLQDAERDGHPVELGHYEQEGYPFFEDYVRTDSGDTATVSADLLLTQAWDGDETGGTYRLSFLGQTTIEPTTVRVSISPPEGMRFTSWGDELSLDGGRLVYEGTPGGNLDLDASFSPSLPVRLWREIVRTIT
jgi:hypothetical protein